MVNLLEDEIEWSLKKLLIFRFLFVYFLLFIAYDLITRVGSMISLPTKTLSDFIQWIGHHIFNVPYERLLIVNNFVDTTYHYVALFCIFVISILGSGFWIIVNRKNKNHDNLYYYLRTVLRYYVGFLLINYGLIKLFQLQFPEPSLHTLVSSYGSSSPRELAWSFLGYSKGYNLFMGIAEIMSVSLFFKRTLTFGLFITFAVTVNVMAINYFYDIPLKIITTHLVFITIFLLLNDIKPLVNFFFNHNYASLALLKKPLVLRKRLSQRVTTILKFGFIIFILVLAGYKLNSRNKILNGEFTKSKFYGIYEVQSFDRNGNRKSSKHELMSDCKYLIMQYRGQVELINTKAEPSFFSSSIDSIVGSINLINPNSVEDILTLDYIKPKKDEIIFESNIQGDSIKMRCRILKESDFLLIKQKFRLINDNPFGK